MKQVSLIALIIIMTLCFSACGEDANLEDDYTGWTKWEYGDIQYMIKDSWEQEDMEAGVKYVISKEQTLLISDVSNDTNYGEIGKSSLERRGGTISYEEEWSQGALSGYSIGGTRSVTVGDYTTHYTEEMVEFEYNDDLYLIMASTSSDTGKPVKDNGEDYYKFLKSVEPISVSDDDTTEVTSQNDAVDTAYEYLIQGGFSNKSLIEQLEYEGFSEDEAITAIEEIDPDWEDQAFLKAKQYTDSSSYTKQGLID